MKHRRVIAETRPALAIGTLVKARALAPGTVTHWQWPGLAVTVTAHDARITIESADTVQHVPIVAGRWKGTVAFWCPGDCGHRPEKLYELNGRFQCWRCHGLTFRSKPLWRTSTAWSAIRLRRKIGVPATLCGPLPAWSRPVHGWRAWRERHAYDNAVHRIRRYEARLLRDLIRFNVVMETHSEAGHDRHGEGRGNL